MEQHGHRPGTASDDAMPHPDFVTRHRRFVPAPPEVVWSALSVVRLTDLRITRPLMALRSLGLRPLPSEPLLENGPVTLLQVRPPHYAVGGMIARPWQLRPEHREVDSLDALATFDEPDWTVVLTDFELEASGEGTELRTQTRGRSTSPRAQQLFARYWTVVGPASGIVRRDMLSSVDRLARA